MSGERIKDRDALGASTPEDKLATLTLLGAARPELHEHIAVRRAVLEAQVTASKATEPSPPETKTPTEAAAVEETRAPSFDQKLAELERGAAETRRTLDAFAAGVAVGRGR
jgi:hypothetical protein